MNNETSRLNQIAEVFNSNNFLEAQRLSKEFTEKYPNNGDGWNLLGLSYKNLAKLQEAIKVFEFLVNGCPKNAFYKSNLGNCYIMLGKISEGIKFFKESIKDDPNFITAYQSLALAYIEINEVDKAKEAFGIVLNHYPNHQKCLYYMGNIYNYSQMWGKAKEYFKKSSYKLSQSHYLENLLYLQEEKEFYTLYKELNDQGLTDPLIGSLISHSNNLFDKKIVNSFCNNSLEYIHTSKVEEEEFSEASLMDIISFYDMNSHSYRSQSLLYNGSQSAGNIFLYNHPSIQDIKKCIEIKIEEYREYFSFKNEGFLENWPNNYDLFGWIVKMKKGGYLESHIHKEGWLSGSFYINIPRKNNNINEGNIVFSEMGPRYPVKDIHKYTRKTIELSTRSICIFPSCIFHETIPFDAKEDRITLAFDVMPK